ncbi:MAG: hypothetical protein RLZZ258_672 [Actinomycetota bacterium]|jgi:peptidyl-prolyl cis-trans isomerase B (cyclophilin B)
MPNNKDLSKFRAAEKRRLAEYQLRVDQQNALVAKRRIDNRKAVLFSAGAILVALALQLSYFAFGPGSPNANLAETPGSVPAISVAENRSWTGEIYINDSTLGITLDGVNAPQATANFVALSKSGFYMNNNCHRLVTEGIYVLQCGDPNGDGTGGPGYSWGPIENAPADDIYPAGTIAMARQGGNGSSMGSQFFIVYKDSPIPSDSAGGYTVLGRITSGLETISNIAADGVSGDGTDGEPKTAAVIKSITVK